MGGGIYSNVRATATSESYAGLNNKEIFKQLSINNAMNPYGIVVRESRDSKEHPNSLPVIVALDVTGSMGSVPNFLVKDGLPLIMDKVIQGGEKDPQVLFLGIGDHECDSSPLQVGQFESSDELLDKWLTDVYLEGGGGGNEGESYSLAWYFAAFHTSTDSFEKRKKKGYLFTIGDEPVLRELPASNLKRIMGDGQYENFSSSQLLERARETFNVYHIHVKETGAGSRQETIDGWKQLMGDNLIIVDKSTNIANAITDTVLATTTTDKVETGEVGEEIIL